MYTIIDNHDKVLLTNRENHPTPSVGDTLVFSKVERPDDRDFYSHDIIDLHRKTPRDGEGVVKYMVVEVIHIWAVLGERNQVPVGSYVKVVRQDDESYNKYADSSRIPRG